MGKHTKTPWEAVLEDQPVCYYRGLIGMCANGTEYISVVASDGRTAGSDVETITANAQRIADCVNAFAPGGVVAELVKAASVIRHHEESVEDFQSRYIKGVCGKLQAVRNLIEAEKP